MAKQIQHIAVIGAGQMGAGIAQVCATHGFHTKLIDALPAALEKGVSGIRKRLVRMQEKGSISASDQNDILSRISAESKIEDCHDVDFVIEAIVENLDIKLSLFEKLSSVCKPDTIISSNTSSISITRMAATIKHPENFIGLHFMNPVPVMQLVEVIRGLQTSDTTYQSALGFIQQIGKTPVTARKDLPGFVVNRILIPMLNEAVFVLMEGIATPEEIDTAMKLGTNQPMGPLELADFVGLDTCLAICRIFHEELGEDKYRPCPLLVKYVEAGWLGRKTGRGFYQYPNG